MRIVHLNPFYFPYAGGIERRMHATGTRLAAQGHDVHVLTARLPGSRAGRTDEDGITVHRLPSRFPLKRLYNPPPVATRGLRETLDEIDPDVVDYHFRWSRSYNQAARHVADGDAALVITYHNTYGEGTGVLRLLSIVNDRLFMRTLRRADRVVAVSRFIHDQLTRKGVDAERMAVVHNGIDASTYDAVDGEPENAPPGPYVVGLGRLVKLKRFDLAVRALADTPDDLHLVLVGKGPERTRLKTLARDHGLADRVHTTGWVSEEEKIRLLKGARALVHPTRFEAFGLGVLEALACGTPAVAADVGGLPEVVGDAGILLDDDPTAWADAIAQMATDTGARDRLAAQTGDQAARFAWDAVTDDLLALYQEAIDA